MTEALQGEEFKHGFRTLLFDIHLPFMLTSGHDRLPDAYVKSIDCNAAHGRRTSSLWMLSAWPLGGLTCRGKSIVAAQGLLDTSLLRMMNPSLAPSSCWHGHLL